MDNLLQKMVYLLFLVAAFGWARARDDNRFNYNSTRIRGNGAMDFGPEEWAHLDCLGNDNIDYCLGYPDKWQLGIEWEIDSNSCRWCPEGEPDLCGSHHQSPIDLKRNRGIINHTSENECIDLHWMNYEDSSCTWQHLVDANSISIERHALRVAQPLEGSFSQGNVRLACPVQGLGRKWGRIDFSKGFSQWWFLSHIDFHVPSEHTQEGKRYSAEAQMYHYYSVSGEEAGVDNELASVTVFLEASEDTPHNSVLDRLICQWRRFEDTTRAACGLDPIQINYPGCFPHMSESQRRNLRNSRPNRGAQPLGTVLDVLDHNAQNPVSSRVNLEIDKQNWEPAQMKDGEWKEWTLRDQSRRDLIENEHLDWFNYFLMLEVRTEYYFRYEGTQTIPPCYGPRTRGSRGNTTHWRVMKDPIRVHPDQILEMERLIASRIAGPGEVDEFRCKPDTAADISPTGNVNVARPIQSFAGAHAMTFCECKDWESRWPEDRSWCEIPNITARFYEHPYNFRTEGF